MHRQPRELVSGIHDKLTTLVQQTMARHIEHQQGNLVPGPNTVQDLDIRYTEVACELYNTITS